MPSRNLFPVGATVTVSDLAGDPHPMLHRLRAAEPVSWLPALDAWLVTSRALAVQVMRDPHAFTVDHPGFSTARVVGPSMLSLDGADHRRHRAPFEASFRRRAVDERFSPVVAATIAGLLDRLAGAGQAELRRDYASPVAVHTMTNALGLEDLPVPMVRGWYDAIVDAVTRVTAGEPVSAAGQAAYAALGRHLRPVLDRDPAHSLLATAAGAATGLSPAEVLSNAAVLLFGGIETTEGMIANAFYHLFAHPAVLEQVRQQPAALAGVIEESLRLEPAAAVVDRYAVAAVRLGDAAVEAGELVRVSLAAANRDPDTFPEPDRFDPWRPNLAQHVTFAHGPHVCLGLHLARLEAQLALAQALARLPGLRLADTATAQAAARPRGLIFRQPQALHAVWQA